MGNYFSREVVDTLQKIAIPRTYEKLNCKGESYQFSGYRDPSVLTYSKTDRHLVTFI